MIDIKNPKPSMLWVFTDEHPDSINDGWMITNPTDPNNWVDLPASYHNGSGVFGYADGHTEIKRWLEASTCVPVRMTSFNGFPSVASRDVKWMIERSSAHPH